MVSQYKGIFQMSSSNLNPKWWQLYLTFPLLIALFVLDARLKLSVRGHQAIQIGILLLVYGLIHLWLKASSSALSKMDQRQYCRTITVIRVPVSQLPDADTNQRQLFELPVSEIEGVLSDTFDIEYIDAEAFATDEVSQVLKRE
jgi:hypothetical protein